MAENETEPILQAVLGQLIREHGLPWRVDVDWSHEVIARDGTIIAKCPNAELATGIIRYVEKYKADLERDGQEIERRIDAGEL